MAINNISPNTTWTNPDIPVTSTGIGNVTINKDVEKQIEIDSIAQSKNAPMYSPIDRLFESYDDVSSFQFGKTSTPYIGTPEVYETRARAQSGSLLAGHAAMQAILGEFVGGTISGVGTLLAPHKWVERVANSADAWNQTVLEKIGESIQDYAKDKFPIYQTAEAQKGFALGDATWWASMTPSIASALSIMIPARAAAFVPAKLARLAAEGRVVSKIRGAATTISGIQKAEYWGSRIGATIAGRVIDSTRESLGRYSQYYAENRANGMSDEDARESAGNAASKGFRYSHLNLIYDFAEWGLILKTGNYLKGDLDDKLKNLLFKDAKYVKAAGIGEELTKEVSKSNKLRGLAFDMLKTSGLEGADEVTMDVLQQEGQYQYAKERGLIKENTFGQRLKDHFGDRKSWDSFIGGAIGGLAMMPMGVIMEKTGNKKYINYLNETKATIAANAELDMKSFETISSHLDDNDRDKAAVERDEMVLRNISRNAANNTSEWTIKMLDGLSRLTPEQIKAKGLNPELLDYINDYKETAKETKRIFDKEMNMIRIKDADGNVDESNAYANARIATAKSHKYLFDKRVEQFTEERVDTNDFKDDNEAFSYYNTLMQTHTNKLKLKNQLDRYTAFVLDSDEKISKLTEDLKTDTNPVSKRITKGFLDSVTKERDFINNLIKETQTVYDNVNEYTNTQLSIYKDINPITKQKVENKFNINKPDSYNNSVSDLYQTRSTELDKDINFWNTEDGLESIKQQYSVIKELDKAELTKDVQYKVDKATTKEELITLRKEYQKDNKDAAIYEPIIKAKESTIKAKEEVTGQTERVQSDISKANAITDKEIEEVINTGKVSDKLVNIIADKISKGQTLTKDEEIIRRAASDRIETKLKDKAKQSDVAPEAQAGSGLFVSDPSSKPSEPVITTDDISVNFDKFNNLSQSALGVLKKNAEDLNDAVGDFIINPSYSASAHMVSMLDILLKDRTIRELFKKTGIVQGQFKVSDVINNLDKFDDISNKNAEQVANIISAIANASTRIIDVDATRGYTATLINNTLISQVVGNVEGIKDEALDMIYMDEGIDKEIVKDVVSTYIDTLKSKTISMAMKLDINNYDENEVASKSSDMTITYNVGTEETLQHITDNIQNGMSIISTLLKNKATKLGHAPKSIKFDDILKYLRDQDTTNKFANDNWFNVLQSLKLIKAQLKYNLAIQRNLKSKDSHTQEITNNNIKRLEELDNILDISTLPYAENKGQEYVDSFLISHPRQVRESSKIAGTRAVLNVYDEDSGKRVSFDDDNIRIVKGNNIWEALRLIKVGAKVTFQIDNTVQYDGKPVDTDWQTVPIRINATDENGKQTTVLFVRELDYMDSGIRYGYKNDNGEFEFRGVGFALNDNDYTTIYNNFETIRDFYSNYYISKSNIKKSAIYKAENNYLKLLEDIKSNKELKDLFLKIINRTVTDTSELVDDFNPASLISIINPFFYKINVEDAYDYYPTPNILKFKITQKDNIYEADFESVKEQRRAIAEGTLESTTISNITTPSILINNNKSNEGEDLPRPTLDRDIKPITLGNIKEPRIVTVMFHKSSQTFVDMATGESINDDRFDYTKAMASHIEKNTDATMYVLLESIGNKLIIFPIHTNTIGLSYENNNDRNAAIDFVASKIIAAEQASTASQLNAAASETKHITILDPTRKLEGSDRHWFDTHFIPDGGVQTDYGFREASNFLRIKTSQDVGSRDGNKRYVYYQIENEKRLGIITIYKSTKWDSIANRNKSSLIKDSEGNVITFDINTKKGLEEFNNYLKTEIVPNMQRQVHIDMSRGKFSYEKELIGSTEEEKPIDPVSEREYNSPQDYYIQTGALYSNVGSVKDTNGNVLTNFDIQGRFPMAVHLAVGRKKQEARTVQGVKELVEQDIIDVNDPYLNFIETVAKSTGIKPKIEITGTTNDIAAASIERRGQRWLLKVYDGFFEQKARNNPYIPASLLIAHEYLHIALSKSYLPKTGESEKDIKDRKERIAIHNRELISWYNEVKTYWNNTTDKAEFIRKSMPNVIMSESRIKSNISIFENYLKAVETDIANPSGTGGTIQEPVTYAFSVPIVAIMLNNMLGKESLDTKPKTAWDKLRDLFFKALSRIFGVKLNDKGFLLKLNHILNTVYSTNIQKGEDVAKGISAQKKEVIITEDVSELTIESEDTSKEVKVEDNDAFKRILDELDLDDFNTAEALDMPTFTIISKSESLESLTNVILNPQEQILDALNNPIC